MRQIKEKSTGTAATVNGANHENQLHIDDTIKNLIRQVEPVNFNLEDLFMRVEQSQGYHNRPQVDKVDRKLTDRLVAEVGIKNFIEYVENEFYSSAMEHEYQGFIYGFRIAVSLLNYASEEYCHD